MTTWRDLETTITRHYAGHRRYRNSPQRGYTIPMPTHGSLTVEITLGRLWASAAIDRWHTTDRDTTTSDAWFRENIWPAVTETCRRRKLASGALPSGPTFAIATPLDRATLPDLLWPWIDTELDWGTPIDTGGENSPVDDAPTRCGDCGTDTLPTEPNQPAEYYMLHDDVWHATGMPPHGHLCIACAETRLGRRLAPADFTTAIINDPTVRNTGHAWAHRTKRLHNRLEPS